MYVSIDQRRSPDRTQTAHRRPRRSK